MRACAVRITHLNLLRKYDGSPFLHVLITRVEQSLNPSLVGGLVGDLLDGDLDRRRLKALGTHGHLNRTGVFRRTYNADKLAGMGGAITVAERLVIRLNAIVETRKNAGAFHLEGHPILGSRDNDTIGILDIHREVREV